MEKAEKLEAENARLRAALREPASWGSNYGSPDPERLRKYLMEVEATARDALGQQHHLTALGYGPAARREME